jgi:hypothetical protein
VTPEMISEGIGASINQMQDIEIVELDKVQADQIIELGSPSPSAAD